MPPGDTRASFWRKSQAVPRVVFCTMMSGLSCTVLSTPKQQSHTRCMKNASGSLPVGRGGMELLAMRDQVAIGYSSVLHWPNQYSVVISCRKLAAVARDEPRLSAPFW